MIISIDKGRTPDKIRCSSMTKSVSGPGIGWKFLNLMKNSYKQLELTSGSSVLSSESPSHPAPIICSRGSSLTSTQEHCDSLQRWSQWHHLCLQIGWYRENIIIMDLIIFLITGEVPWSFRYLFFFLIDWGKAMTKTTVSFVRVLVLKTACRILLWAVCI